MECIPERIYTFLNPRAVSRPTSTPSIRQPIPGKLCHLSPLQVFGLGRQKRYQILRRLSTLQTRPHLFACRVSPQPVSSEESDISNPVPP